MGKREEYIVLEANVLLCPSLTALQFYLSCNCMDPIFLHSYMYSYTTMYGVHKMKRKISPNGYVTSFIENRDFLFCRGINIFLCIFHTFFFLAGVFTSA